MQALEDVSSALFVYRLLVLAAEQGGGSVQLLNLHVIIDHERRGWNRVEYCAVKRSIGVHFVCRNVQGDLCRWIPISMMS
jgi:hypothetical protein